MIAIVVPTCRPDLYREFLVAWTHILRRHEAHLVTVWDGDEPHVEHVSPSLESSRFSLLQVPEENRELFSRHTDAVRNLGFYYAALRIKRLTVLVSLDDDVLPAGDPIHDHLQTLSRRVSIDWFNPLSWDTSIYPRGFPYGVRLQAPVMVSHGMWEGVPDLDAQTQLQHPDCTDFRGPYYRGPVPRGPFLPICGMNLAVSRDALPYLYYAPAGAGYPGWDRFADIFMGLRLKRVCDEKGWAIFNDGARVFHRRASDPNLNHSKERLSVSLNEVYWTGAIPEEFQPFVTRHETYATKWRDLIGGLLKR
jgi:Reversibly glycosylated polypeptide